MISRLPDKPTTPEERQVIAWLAITIAVLVGIVAFYLSFRAGGAEQASALRSLSFWSIGCAVFIWIIKRAIAIYMDY